MVATEAGEARGLGQGGRAVLFRELRSDHKDSGELLTISARKHSEIFGLD